jgi:hypothetical protein
VSTGLVLSVLEVVHEQRLRAGDPFARVRAAEPADVQRRRSVLVGAMAAVLAAGPTWAALAPGAEHPGAAGTAGAARLIAGCPERPVGLTEQIVLISNTGALDWSAGSGARRTPRLTWPTDLASATHEGVVDVWARDGAQTDFCRLDVRP